MNKEIPLETLAILLDRWSYAKKGELSTLTLGVTIDCVEEYDFTNIKERLLQDFKSIFDEQNRLGQI